MEPKICTYPSGRSCRRMVTMFRHAKTSLEIQDDPLAEQQLLTATLLISWSQLLLDSSQKDLMKILQASNYGKSKPAAGKPSKVKEYFSNGKPLPRRSKTTSAADKRHCVGKMRSQRAEQR